MPKAVYLERFAKPLICLDSSATIEAIQTKMFSTGVSTIPLISRGLKRNDHVVRRKTIWSWMYRNGGATPRLEDVREPALPEVETGVSLATAMEKLDGSSAVLIRNGKVFTHFLSPRVVANALRDYSEKFLVIEDLEIKINKRLALVSREEIAESLDNYDVDLSKLTFSHYHKIFSKLWEKLVIEPFDKKLTLQLIDRVREYRNAVMHFRLDDSGEGEASSIELLNLLKHQNP